MTPSHIKTRGSGGGDEPWNVVPMHLSEHRRWEDDRYSFSMEHPAFYQKLQAMGWKFIEVVGQVRLVRRGELEHGVMDTYNDCVRPFKEFPYQENNITHICRRPKRKKRS